MIVDAHAHLVPPSYRRALASAGIDRPDGFPHIPKWSAEGAIASMDENGIDAALLSISSPGVGFADDPSRLAREVNVEGADAVRDHPGRLGLIATLPLPDVDAALDELAVAADELQADGFLLLTNYDGLYLGDERLDPVMAELDRRGSTLVLHPTSPPAWEAVALGRPRPMIEFPFDTTRAVVNLVLGGALQRFPHVRIIVPHVGAALPVLADRVQGFTSAFGEHVDVLGQLASLFYDLAGDPLPNALPAVLRLAGAGQVLYGSDMPFNPPQGVTAGLERLRATSALSDDDRAAVLAGNALRLFPRFDSEGERDAG